MKNYPLHKILILIFLVLITVPNFAQKKRKAFLKETRYWDKGKTKLLSNGYIHNDPSFTHFGQKEGEWTFWYRNGKVKEKSNFTNGKYNGASLHYYQTGKPMVSTFFKNGLEDSTCFSYFQNGSRMNL